MLKVLGVVSVLGALVASGAAICGPSQASNFIPAPNTQVSLASTEDPGIPSDTLEMYEARNFYGKKVTFKGPYRFVFEGPDWRMFDFNDKMSSFKIGSNLRAKFCRG